MKKKVCQKIYKRKRIFKLRKGKQVTQKKKKKQHTRPTSVTWHSGLTQTFHAGVVKYKLNNSQHHDIFIFTFGLTFVASVG
jgi:hypothetical protein